MRACIPLVAALLIPACAAKNGVSVPGVGGARLNKELTLISNQELTDFYIVSDGQKTRVGQGKIVPIRVNKNTRYEILAHPRGYRPMSLFTIVPPTDELRFTFEIGDKDGSVPDHSQVLPPVTTAGLAVCDRFGAETLALLPTRSDTGAGVDNAVGDKLNYLFSETRRFQIVERGRIRDAIEELNFQQSDLVDQTNAVRMGKLLGANYILLSSVSRPGDGRRQVFAKLVSVKTGRQVATAIAECRGDAVPIPTLIQVVNKITAAQ